MKNKLQKILQYFLNRKLKRNRLLAVFVEIIIFLKKTGFHFDFQDFIIV